MYKILIVDDRENRQEQFLLEGLRDVEKLWNLSYVNNVVGTGFTSFINELQGDNELNQLKEFDLLIFHRSTLVEFKLINKIQSFSKINKKFLILFSGSISQHLYSQQDFPFLLINSKDFYSIRLFEFLKNFSETKCSLLNLLYGEDWKLTYLLKYKQVLNGVEFPGYIDEAVNPVRDELEEFLGIKTVDQIDEEISQIVAVR